MQSTFLTTEKLQYVVTHKNFRTGPLCYRSLSPPHPHPLHDIARSGAQGATVCQGWAMPDHSPLALFAQISGFHRSPAQGKQAAMNRTSSPPQTVNSNHPTARGWAVLSQWGRPSCPAQTLPVGLLPFSHKMLLERSGDIIPSWGIPCMPPFTP